MTSSNTFKNGKKDSYFGTDSSKKTSLANGCNTPQSSSSSIMSFS